jgi:hypothetical protein
VSEEDFDTLQQTELAAFAERAKRRAETVPSLSETQVAAALKALYGGITRRLDLTAVGATVTALSRVQDNPSAASPADMCAFIRMMVIGANAAYGPDASLAIRYVVDPLHRAAK